MSSSPPPGLAVWLLREAGPVEADEALLGDLLEEYERHGSASWFWRQTMAAILLGAWRDAVRHWLLILPATIIGWIVLMLPIAFLFGTFWLYGQGLIGREWIPTQVGVTRQFAAALMSGWVVAQLFSEVRAAAVLTLAATVVCVALLGLGEVLRRGVYNWETFGVFVAAVIWAVLLCATSIVIGGFIGRRGRGVLGLSGERVPRERVDRVMNVLRPMRDL